MSKSRTKIKAKFKKLPWEDMTVTRVHLNPEQAVLTCCDTSSRAFGTAGASQCGGLCGSTFSDTSS